jgi:glycosyltransferase involved in cell wall biosynthesis
LPEVLGDAADYVDAALLEADRDAGVDALAEALRRVLTDEARRAELVELGRARAARYSWDRTAGAIAELYRRVSAPG